MKKLLLGILLIVLVLAAVVFVRQRIRANAVAIPITTVPAGETAVYAAGTYGESITTRDGRTRTYLLHIPAGYSATKSYPLVLLLHGGYGTGEQALQQTHFTEKADAEGFIVVAPDGVDKHWSDGNRPDVANDVAFTRELLTHLSSVLPINEKKMYVTGISNGGQMTLRLGCELPGVFAAIAPDVAPLSEILYATCNPPPIALVAIQGEADPLMPIEGGQGKGEGGPKLSAAATMKRWAEINGCNPTPTITHVPPTVQDGTSVDKYVYAGCDADVVYYIVQGMGHGWPPTPPTIQRVSGKTSQNINATDVFWDFFSAHSRP